MSNVLERRMTQAHTSNEKFDKIVSHPERVIRNPAKMPFLTTMSRQGQKVQEQIDTLDDALRSDEKGPTSIPDHDTTPAPESLSQLLNHSQLHAQIREIAQEEASHNNAVEMDKYFEKAAKDALSDPFQIVFELANDGLKIAFFGFVESFLTNSALKEALDDIIDKNIYKRASISFFMYLSACRALTTAHFVRPVANFIRENVEEQDEKVEETKTITEVPFSLPSSTPLSSEVSAEP